MSCGVVGELGPTSDVDKADIDYRWYPIVRERKLQSYRFYSN